MVSGDMIASVSGGVGSSGSTDHAVVSERVDEACVVPVVHDKTFSAASFIASLLSSSSVTERTVQSVIEHMTALVSDIVHDIARV